MSSRREFIALLDGAARGHSKWRAQQPAMPVITATASCDLSDTRWRSQEHRHNLVESA
jgi:hypothetical protein